ncbi:hypothetical protein JCM10212_001895 [Sporobolomyces blumeae]
MAALRRLTRRRPTASFADEAWTPHLHDQATSSAISTGYAGHASFGSRLHRRAPANSDAPRTVQGSHLPIELDSATLSSIDTSNTGSTSASTQPQSAGTSGRRQAGASPSETPSRAASSNAGPKAHAVLGSDALDDPFWANAGGIFRPDAQHPEPVSSLLQDDDQGQDSSPNVAVSPPPRTIADLPPSAIAGISALLLDSSRLATPTVARTVATLSTVPTASSPSPTLSTALAASSASVSQPASIPSTVVTTESSIAISSSAVTTTTFVSSSSESTAEPSPSSAVAASSTGAVAPAVTANPNFFTVLGSSPANIAITTLVCVGILALLIAFLFFFIRRCTRRRKKQRMGDLFLLDDDEGRHARGWETPGPGWTEKYYGEQIGGRMVGGGRGGASTRSASDSGRPVPESWAGEGREPGYEVGDVLAMQYEGGWGIARRLSQQRHDEQHRSQQAHEWSAYPHDDGIVDTHVLDYEFPAPAPPSTLYHPGSMLPPPPSIPPPAAVRPEPYAGTRLDEPATMPPPRPSFLTTSYPSNVSESEYPPDELEDAEKREHLARDEQDELAQTMADLNLSSGLNEYHSYTRRDPALLPPIEADEPVPRAGPPTNGSGSWRDSLDWVMGSAADLIGSRLLSRNGSDDTMVDSATKSTRKSSTSSQSGDEDKYTRRRPRTSIVRPLRLHVKDPRTVSDAFTPLSETFGDKFLLPRSPRRDVPGSGQGPLGSTSLTRESSIVSFASSTAAARPLTTLDGFGPQGTRNRLFTAATAHNANVKLSTAARPNNFACYPPPSDLGVDNDEDEQVEVLDSIATLMMTRGSSPGGEGGSAPVLGSNKSPYGSYLSSTAPRRSPSSSIPSYESPSLPLAVLDASSPRRTKTFYSSPDQYMTRSDSRSTSSSFTYRPSPRSQGQYLGSTSHKQLGPDQDEHYDDDDDSERRDDRRGWGGRRPNASGDMARTGLWTSVSSGETVGDGDGDDPARGEPNRVDGRYETRKRDWTTRHDGIELSLV